MNRLAVKLTAGFIVVAVLAVGLVSYLANRATADEFAAYVSYSAAVPPPMLRNALARSYAEHGSWARAQPDLQQLAVLAGARLIISDEGGRVLADSGGQSFGRTLSDSERSSRVPLVVDGRTVGFLHYWEADAEWQPRLPPRGGMMGEMMGRMMGRSMGAHMVDLQDTPARNFLAEVNNALWVAGLLSVIVAAALALLLVRQITQPLRALTDAAARIAKGDLSHRVAVGSRDEVGELALAFNAMADNLARDEQLRRHLVADIAHELRTPLAVIQGNLEGMRDGVVAPTPEQLASVHEESLLLARLIDDLRELSLVEAGQLPLRRVAVDLAELARRAVGQVQSQARARQISVVAEVSVPVPPVSADPDRIGQVLHNLLSNALRHTPPGGRIVVSAIPQRDALPGGENDAAGAASRPANTLGWVTVSVADTGAGIPAEDLPRVFDRFYRVDKSRTRASGGSGIGLAIVKQLVLAHEGRVWATSAVGGGSTFSFALPTMHMGPLTAETQRVRRE